MHPTTPCAVVYKFVTFFFTVFYSFFFTFFKVFYKVVEWAGDFGAGDLGGLHLPITWSHGHICCESLPTSTHMPPPPPMPMDLPCQWPSPLERRNMDPLANGPPLLKEETAPPPPPPEFFFTKLHTNCPFLPSFLSGM